MIKLIILSKFTVACAEHTLWIFRNDSPRDVRNMNLFEFLNLRQRQLGVFVNNYIRFTLLIPGLIY